MLKLNDDMDKALKGEIESVEKKYKNEIIDQLIDTVNSALSRIPKSGSDTGAVNAGGGGDEQAIVDNLMSSIEYMTGISKQPLMVLDNEMRVRSANNAFEELTGIRGAVGEVIDTVSRDESFPSLVKEMAEKAAAAAGEDTLEEYDFPSGPHKIHAQAVRGVPGKTEAYLFFFEKQGE